MPIPSEGHLGAAEYSKLKTNEPKTFATLFKGHPFPVRNWKAYTVMEDIVVKLTDITWKWYNNVAEQLKSNPNDRWHRGSNQHNFQQLYPCFSKIYLKYLFVIWYANVYHAAEKYILNKLSLYDNMRKHITGVVIEWNGRSYHWKINEATAGIGLTGIWNISMVNVI